MFDISFSKPPSRDSTFIHFMYNEDKIIAFLYITYFFQFLYIYMYIYIYIYIYILNLPLYAALIKFDVAIFTFKKLLKMTVLKQHLEKTDMDKLGQNF